jgi:hypothetical protein
MIDLKHYILPTDDYVIIKRTDIFPKYAHHSDVDIVCYDAKQLGMQIIDRAHNNGINLKAYFTHDKHFQLDYHLKNGALDIKFDLIDHIDFFKSDEISRQFIHDMLSTSQCVELNNHKWRVPSIEFEICVRAIEYKMHPHKIKHKLFVDKHLNSTNKKQLEKYGLLQ